MLPEQKWAPDVQWLQTCSWTLKTETETRQQSQLSLSSVDGSDLCGKHPQFCWHRVQPDWHPSTVFISITTHTARKRSHIQIKNRKKHYACFKQRIVFRTVTNIRRRHFPEKWNAATVQHELTHSSVTLDDAQLFEFNQSSMMKLIDLFSATCRSWKGLKEQFRQKRKFCY